jgi:hypothetical protein
MKLLHFVRRNPWQFIINNEYFLCTNDKVLQEIVRELMEEYSIDEKEIELDTFEVCEIEKTESRKKIKFLPFDFRKIMIKV